MKNVLLISPTWVNIHEDLMEALRKQGMKVELFPEYSFPEDSLRIKGKKTPVTPAQEDEMKSAYWKEQFNKTTTSFDFALVIDGQGVNSYLFEELKSRNPLVYCVNYLYDVTYSIYHFEACFNFYDKVFTFDRKDAELYGINLLPIYWSPIEEISDSPVYEIFGFGSYSENWLRLYSQIKELAENMGKICFIKLHHKPIKNILIYRLKNRLRSLLNLPRLISPSIYKSDMITNEFISTNDFRQLIAKSDVILDTKVHNQDGLTARFMWALGLGKKIITTNEAVRNYDFYTKDQILVLEDKYYTKDELLIIKRFIEHDYNEDSKIRDNIDKLRIDNWLNTIMTK